MRGGGLNGEIESEVIRNYTDIYTGESFIGECLELEPKTTNPAETPANSIWNHSGTLKYNTKEFLINSVENLSLDSSNGTWIAGLNSGGLSNGSYRFFNTAETLDLLRIFETLPLSSSGGIQTSNIESKTGDGILLKTDQDLTLNCGSTKQFNFKNSSSTCGVYKTSSSNRGALYVSNTYANASTDLKNALLSGVACPINTNAKNGFVAFNEGTFAGSGYPFSCNCVSGGSTPTTIREDIGAFSIGYGALSTNSLQFFVADNFQPVDTALVQRFSISEDGPLCVGKNYRGIYTSRLVSDSSMWRMLAYNTAGANSGVSQEIATVKTFTSSTGGVNVRLDTSTGEILTDSSSRREKQNIVYGINDLVDEFLGSDVQASTFNYKCKPNELRGVNYIAEDLFAVSPLLCTYSYYTDSEIANNPDWATEGVFCPEYNKEENLELNIEEQRALVGGINNITLLTVVCEVSRKNNKEIETLREEHEILQTNFETLQTDYLNLLSRIEALEK